MTGAREQQKRETRRQILLAAKALFGEHGYQKTTTKQIAERAGVAAGTVFVHFPDKASLLAASLLDGIDGVVEEAFATLPDADLVAQLLHFARALYGWYRQDPELSRALLRESLFLTGEWDQRFREQSMDFLGRLCGLIESAKERGEIDEEIDSMLAALSFFACYFTALLGVVKEEDSPLEGHLILLERTLRYQLRLPMEPLLTALPSTEE